MNGKWLKRFLAAIVVVAGIAGMAYALRPKPVAVDIAVIDQGPLAVTVDEEGVARIRDVFRVSAPIPGTLERLPVRVGDSVVAGTTEVASIRPATPAFLDIRTRGQLEAAAAAAKASVARAKAGLDVASAAQNLAQGDFDRARGLVAGGTISQHQFEQAISALAAANAQVDLAKADLAAQASMLAAANAQLIEPVLGQPSQSEAASLPVLAPVSGVVLNLISQSEQVLAAGTALLEIGDPRNMEIVVHLLSQDAANIPPGTAATIDGWGGPELAAKVLRIDPAAYTKVSALGIEEQRVDGTLELAAPYEEWKTLGHSFRVMAHIQTWQSDNVTRVPLGALFRRGSDWAVYRVVDGRAASTVITIGHRSGLLAEVIDGLTVDDKVVLHPSDAVTDGTAVEARSE